MLNTPLTERLQHSRRALVALARNFSPGEETAEHHHQRAQLVHAASGVMRVYTPGRSWIVPPGRALWVPPMRDHKVVPLGAIAMRTLFIAPEAARSLPPQECVMAVSPLLAALIERTAAMDADALPSPAEARILRVVLDEIRALPALPLFVPIPAAAEREVALTCSALLRDPGSRRSLEEWAARAGLSGRTLERRFRAATGLSFGRWRQQARLLEAVARLAGGTPVTRVALDLGYDSPSAFSAMFRRVLGAAPSRFDRTGASPAHSPSRTSLSA